MRRPPARPCNALAPLAALRVVVAAACLAATAAWAEPAGNPSAPARAASGPSTPAAGDLITQFLGDRGLVPAAGTEPSLARQVRDRAADWTSELVWSAMNFLGVRYRRGGDSADEGFDCSGFTRHVFEASIGLVLPRRANEQAKAKTLEPVKREQLKPGDLVFFNTLRSTFSHVGIYVGEGKFIHAPRTGGEVRVEDMRVAYWSKRYNGARRALASGEAAAPQAAPGSERVATQTPAAGADAIGAGKGRPAPAGEVTTPSPSDIVY